MVVPLIEVRSLCRDFPAGDETVSVLRNIDLDIWRGELLAIIGHSGSGKSTLMNILGCLDQPTSGTYHFNGRDVGALDADELAELRREHFGFVFQRYQLLPDLTAIDNVEVPAIYAGTAKDERETLAVSLLTRLGLGERLRYHPNQLSGGQQQRVSVARALINGGEVIFADEPTGALDSQSGQELLALLDELHRDGHTVVIITHDPAVAALAERTVEIKDGVIIADTKTVPLIGTAEPKVVARRSRLPIGVTQIGQAFRTAVRAMAAHRLRTFLTMLGIIIGIASVVGVVALGQGSQQRVLENISAIGTNTITVTPGNGFADRNAPRIRTLVASDADALALQPYADSVSPTVNVNQTLRYGNVSTSASVSGVGASYFQVSGKTTAMGQTFDNAAVTERSQDAVIDQRTVDTLFAGNANPLGKVIIIGSVPVRVIGVVANSTGFGPDSNSLNVWIPYTTAMARIVGQSRLSSITVRVADDYDMDQAQANMQQLLEERHGLVDFSLRNSATIRETIASTTQTLTLLISMIAVISLLVGGIGVMNIMLVSVSERTKEIGVRMAVGARRSDILQQFLIEAVLVCLVGGVAGVLLAFAVGNALSSLLGVRLSYSTTTIFAAFVSSSLIGIAFGFMPARSASRLNPVDALARE